MQYTDDEICFRGYKESAEDETQTVEVEEKAVDEEIKVWKFFTWSLDYTCENCSKQKKYTQKWYHWFLLLALNKQTPTNKGLKVWGIS